MVFHDILRKGVVVSAMRVPPMVKCGAHRDQERGLLAETGDGRRICLTGRAVLGLERQQMPSKVAHHYPA